MRFAYVDRWQQSLRGLFEQKPSNEQLLALLEARDRELEAYLAGPGWEDYTPTDTNITVGDGTQTARKRVHADGTVDFTWRLVWGATTAITGNASIGLPVAVAGRQTAVCRYLDNTTRHYVGVCSMAGSAGLLIHTESGSAGVVTATAPFTFISADSIEVSGTCEPEET